MKYYCIKVLNECSCILDLDKNNMKYNFKYFDKNDITEYMKYINICIGLNIPFLNYDGNNTYIYRYNSFGDVKINIINYFSPNCEFNNLSIYEQDKIDECKIYNII